MTQRITIALRISKSGGRCFENKKPSEALSKRDAEMFGHFKCLLWLFLFVLVFPFLVFFFIKDHVGDNWGPPGMNFGTEDHFRAVVITENHFGVNRCASDFSRTPPNHEQLECSVCPMTHGNE